MGKDAKKNGHLKKPRNLLRLVSQLLSKNLNLTEHLVRLGATREELVEMNCGE